MYLFIHEHSRDMMKGEMLTIYNRAEFHLKKKYLLLYYVVKVVFYPLTGITVCTHAQFSFVRLLMLPVLLI
jgi:hypothetical protein